MPSEGSDFSEDHDSPKQNRNKIILSIRKSMRKIKNGKVMKLMVMIRIANSEQTNNLAASLQIPFQTIFQKQSSDDLDASGSDQNKKKLSKIVVECRKEGLVNYVSPEYLKNDNKDLTKLEWEKCKLVLVKCAGGYMLEFHSLDKTPKVGDRCAMIGRD